ncbi:hypothetical protein FQN54_005731 [Arachnomyces sp. PD_36]|nr:hypothetical protein FQN54_005731 [Arachnomyces sp. PD_36]
MSNPKPSICIIHGAWHHPAYYQPLVDALQNRGHETICPRLPSCTEGFSYENSLAEDVACIRRNVTELIDAGKEVVAIMHSYGGVVGTEALFELGLEHRESIGKVGGVKRMVYMTAFIPQVGQSLAGIFGGGLPPFIEVKDDENLLLIPDAAPFFYNDLSPEDAEYWSKQIVKHPKPAQFTPIKHEAYRAQNKKNAIPVTYIRCEKDTALIPDVQQMMIDTITKSGIEVSVEHCEGSHSPFLSIPEVVAGIVERVA